MHVDELAKNQKSWHFRTTGSPVIPGLSFHHNYGGRQYTRYYGKNHAAYHYGEFVEALVISDNPTVASVQKTYKLDKGRVVRIKLSKVSWFCENNIHCQPGLDQSGQYPVRRYPVSFPIFDFYVSTSTYQCIFLTNTLSVVYWNL